jgi:2-polyprenyl-6-methoxyphenol hydroxylase-like FAD-dependent oxidoreductase
MQLIHADVLIVGGGAAGATAALNLAPMRRVVLADKQRQSPARIGEALPPVARLLLTDIGLMDEFIAQGQAPCYGSCSIWGQIAPTGTTFCAIQMAMVGLCGSMLHTRM